MKRIVIGLLQCLLFAQATLCALSPPSDTEWERFCESSVPEFTITDATLEELILAFTDKIDKEDKLPFRISFSSDEIRNTKIEGLELKNCSLALLCRILSSNILKERGWTFDLSPFERVVYIYKPYPVTKIVVYNTFPAQDTKLSVETLSSAAQGVNNFTYTSEMALLQFHHIVNTAFFRHGILPTEQLKETERKTLLVIEFHTEAGTICASLTEDDLFFHNMPQESEEFIEMNLRWHLAYLLPESYFELLTGSNLEEKDI